MIYIIILFVVITILICVLLITTIRELTNRVTNLEASKREIELNMEILSDAILVIIKQLEKKGITDEI